MKKLPIHDVLQEIKDTFKTQQSLILEAPPGAGKSTIVPISFLGELFLGNKQIIMLEPRRIAARMVATRMAKLLGEEVGQSVGYQIKMDSLYSKKTKILVVTEAILVKKLQANQSLDDVAMIIFDEFHERSIHTDLSLALAIEVQSLLRDDLKLLVMSATLNSDSISGLLPDAKKISSFGKSYEIENIYLDIKTPLADSKNINQLLFKTVIKSIKEDDGDILVFLAGTKEIKKLQNSLNEVLNSKDILVLELYSNLSKKEQEKALEINKKRKIILSTNIAQTSLTIEGVKVVIDSGLEKLSRYNYSNSMNHLELSFISLDSSIQRAGRAGRLSNGKCYKLWHETKILLQSTQAEILRSDLSSLVLDLALWGSELNELKFLDIPQNKIIQKTKDTLYKLKMLDKSYKITNLGRQALKLGLHPRFAYMILRANELSYAYEACILAALLSEKDIYLNSFRDSDLLSRFMSIYNKEFDNNYINKFYAKEILKQADSFYVRLKKIQTIQKKYSAFKQDMISILLLFAYPDRLAKQREKNGNRYILSNSKGAIIHNEDTLFNQEYLVVANLHAQNKDSFINLALSISMPLIKQYFKHLIKDKQNISYNKDSKKFDIKIFTQFLNLTLEIKTIKDTSNINYKKLLIELIKKEGLELLTWSKKAVNLKNRLNFINHHKKEEFTGFSDEELLKTLDTWLEPYLDNIKTIKELEQLDMYIILTSLISWDKQELLNSLAPLSIKVPSGSNIFIDYSNSEKPCMSVRLQEMFGLNDTPCILNSSLALQIQLLSPASRPVAITYDLKSFWHNSYDDVAKELRGKYKKHYWPKDPFEAVATSKIKKYMKL
ncbi:MAG: ATP-dependent helicase HrpB [Sulfurimonas sp.]|nr:MAG: ATP-dependent helicase HrpB [Sulfurimonas sp.]